MKKQRQIGGYILATVMVIVAILVILKVEQNYNRTQSENLRLGNELQAFKAEKELCDNLKIGIRGSSVSEMMGGVADSGVNYCLYSNKDTSARIIITLINGQKVEADVGLVADKCMMKQTDNIMGYTGHGYRGGVNCEDIKSIELVSTQCSTVTAVVTDMTKLACGI